MANRLRWLLERGHIAPDRERRWQAIRELRNVGSHADRQSLIMPVNALQSLTVLRHEIDALFSEQGVASDKAE